MSAYAIFQIEVTDPQAYEEYKRGAPATIEKFGGRYVVRGGAMEVLEGEWPQRRVVVLEFPSMEQAQRWHRSQEYAELKAMRARAAHTDAVLLEGV